MWCNGVKGGIYGESRVLGMVYFRGDRGDCYFCKAFVFGRLVRRLNLADMMKATEQVKQTNQLDQLNLTAREKEIAAMLLQDKEVVL